MIAWARHLRVGIAALIAAVVAPSIARSEAVPTPAQWEAAAAPVSPKKPATEIPATPAQLQARARAAERIGDWEAAFAAYCDLYAIDRTAPVVREKLNAALRRVQQARRHRESTFRQFVAGLQPPEAVNLFAEAVAKVPGLFADPAKAAQQLWANGIEELDRALGSTFFREAFLDAAAVDKVDAFRTSLRTFWSKRPVADARDARSSLKQLIAAAQDTFPVRVPAALAIEFLCGACSGLDEYTVFLTPSHNADIPVAGPDLTAYGLYLAHSEGGVFVDRVATGSWAAFHTPLRSGDRITTLNGRSLARPGPTVLADALRMPVNGVHEIEYTIPNSDECPVVRLPLTVPSVYGPRMVNSVAGIGYVRVREFTPVTPRKLGDAVAELRGQGLRALVLDLRGNHGGSFLAGVEVARRFLPGGLIVTTQGQLGQVAGQVFSSDSGMNAIDVPLVVLIDAETASAAEVVAAALRDNHRAELVGMPTFGKGTIQYPLHLTAADEPEGMSLSRPRSGTVRVTIARLYGPSGSPLNGHGITPHFVQPNPARQLDLALERALDLLQPMPLSPVPLPPPSD